MPTYDYVCSTCGHRMEVLHGVHDRGPAECPVCGGPMKKAFSPPTIHFKGTGWAKKERSSSTMAHRRPKEKATEGASGDSAPGGAKTGDSSGGSGGASSASSGSSGASGSPAAD